MIVTGKVTGLKRRHNTPSGNPQWEIVLDGHTKFPYRLGLDADLAHRIENPEYAEIAHTFEVRVAYSTQTIVKEYKI